MKNIFKNIKNTIIWGIVVVMTATSCNFLDVAENFEETLKWDSIFTSKRNLERYIWTLPANFPDEGSKFSQLGSFATDEAFSIHRSDYASIDFILGNVTPTSMRASFAAIWNDMYIVIRRANTILANIHLATDLVGRERDELTGYVIFMRAYAYYRLAMHFGPVVLLGDDVLETNDDPISYDRPRATFDETIDYICGEFERASQLMPQTVPTGVFGRPVAGSALGLSARLRLIQASPLWNGGTAARRTYGTWLRSTDNVNYVSQTYDESKWAQAAIVCQRIINGSVGQFALHTVPITPITPTPPVLPDNVPMDMFPDGAGGIDPFLSFTNMFNGEAPVMLVPEFLWARRSPGIENYTRHCFPYRRFNGYGTVSVPQKIIDAFLMADGRTIYNSSEEYPYSTDGFWWKTQGEARDSMFSGFRILGRGEVHNRFINREIRFYASIGFDGRVWPMTSNSSVRNQTFRYGANAEDGKNSGLNLVYNINTTGYSLTKWVHPEDSWGGAGGTSTSLNSSRRVTKAYPIIRYAEILLAYVEALNNLTTSHTLVGSDGETYTISRLMTSSKNLSGKPDIEYYFNMVRFRVGLPGLTAAELASPETMQAVIERERMVELLHEDARFWDVRRWGQYESSEREPILGLDMDANGYPSQAFYNVVPVNQAIARNRVVDRRLILLPIPLNEVRKSPSLDQNPGYQQ